MNNKEAKEGDKLICPNCKIEFELANWQIEDGTCGDGQYYCLNSGSCCGCTFPTEMKKK